MILLLLGCPPVPSDDTAKDALDSADTAAWVDDTGPCEDNDHDGDCLSDDCDDADAAIGPSTEETCNGVDDDCDGYADEGLATVYYRDGDGDGYGDPEGANALCEPRSDYADNGEDCDDTDDSVYPGADERPNGSDDDCDGEVDEGVAAFSATVTWDSAGVTVSITGAASRYDFGMSETGAGDLGWFGESCIPGDEPWGYPDYGWDVCHALSSTGGRVVSVYPDIGAVQDGYTLFPDSLAPNITYVVIDGDSGDCYAWGDDPSYYSGEGCSEL